jgi:hypothetical protein
MNEILQKLKDCFVVPPRKDTLILSFRYVDNGQRTFVKLSEILNQRPPLPLRFSKKKISQLGKYNLGMLAYPLSIFYFFLLNLTQNKQFNNLTFQQF